MVTASQKKTTLRIDEKILAEVVSAAQRDNRSVNQQIVYYLREALKREAPFHSPAAKA